MREMAQYTKIGPSDRVQRLLTFNRRLAQSHESANHLREWDLGLDPELVKIPGRIMPYPELTFGNGRKYVHFVGELIEYMSCLGCF